MPDRNQPPLATEPGKYKGDDDDVVHVKAACAWELWLLNGAVVWFVDGL